ncbi:MAG: YunC family protein [Candidatus Altarchaeaceae archaeon]
MIEINKIENCIGIKIDMGNANLLIIKGKKGYIMCGYLNIETANKLNDVACIVKGVKNFDDVLNSEIVEISEKAKEIGIKVGMKGKDVLKFIE